MITRLFGEENYFYAPFTIFYMRKFSFTSIVILALSSLCLSTLQVSSQCGTTINTFPYVQDFETGQGGWTAGGTSNDWAWGTPAKTVITSAGSGSKCWVTGGLSGSFYNYGERSYVKSPCFDFSTLQYPMIDFLIFWDSEHTYDGMVLQSSINGGTTWVNVGAYGDAVNCENQNWYNTNSVTNLNNLATVKNGWTGNNLPTAGSCQGGSGSLKWVEAKHCLSGLGGQPSVMFRFAFGAGTTCNDFDGIAFDSVGIGESPTIAANFTTTCLPNRKVSFTGITSQCPNSFAWNFGDPNSGASNTATTINATHTFSAPGSYTVSFTAGGPCNAPATYTGVINVLGVTDSVSGVLCAGQNNGSINLAVAGGVTPYTFSWSNGATTQNISGLPSGTYSVSVSDPQGCAVNDTFVITQPAQLLVTDSATNATCIGNNGTITLTVTGGTIPYSFNWGGGITSQNRNGLGTGTYTVSVTDAHGCSAISGATITSAAPLVAELTPTNVLCFGTTGGSIILNTTGGITPYTYNWGGGIITQNRTGLPAGTYSVTVTDATGCSATASTTITQPGSAINITLVPVNATCTVGGTITTTVTGGEAGYTYNWGAGITTPDRIGLGAGTYTITVTDLNNCTATASVAITSSATIQITPAITNVLCHGGNNGSINITATGGTGGFTYNWGGGITTQNRTGLSAGTYDITVTDNSSCTASASVTISDPAVLVSTTTVINVSCFGGSNGSITLSDSGGTSPYTYNWGGGIITQNRTGLSAGTYTVTVTDHNGCTTSTSALIGQSTQLVITDSVTNVLCFGVNTGTVTATVSGGNPPYNYNWGTGNTTNPTKTGLAVGSYTLTVTDSTGCTATATSSITQPTQIGATTVATTTACDSATGTITLTITGGAGSNTFIWSNGATTQNIAQLISNAYSVTVTDANGCTATASNHVSQTVAPQITLVVTPTSCSGDSDGNINANVTGGTPGYTYLWSNTQISSGISGLNSGTYTVTVHDAHNCTAVAADSVTSPPPIVIFLSIADVKCFGDSTGAGQVTASGGTPAYHYSWSNGDSTANPNNFSAGTYTLTVTDAKLCAGIFPAIISEPAQLIVSSHTDSTTCGLSNGGAQIFANGGRVPYSYNWQPGVSDSSSAVGLNTGMYTVVVTDSSGCTVLDTLIVGGKNTIIERPNLGVDTFICPGNESIGLNAGVYQSYFWQDSSTLQRFTVSDSGTYWVIVTDSNGCKSSDSITVIEKCDMRFVVPNAFTPNGDGKNDFFKPVFIDAPAKYSIHIYDRWGAMVYESNDVNAGWDGTYKGKAQPSGAFIYYIQYNYAGQKTQGIEGAFQLLR